MADDVRGHRDVVSFVRRSTRMRPHQRQAYQAHRDRFLLEVRRAERSTSVHPDATLDLTAAFGRHAPLVVEIGPGTGESLVPMAAARPELNVLALEVYEPAIAAVVAALHREDLANVRVVMADAVAALRSLLPEGSVAELWTFFPDPWPKARHHKRRLVDAEFVDLAARRVGPGGVWRLATDWPDYAAVMRDLLDAHPAWQAVEVEPVRPETRFEIRGRAAGRPIADLVYRRV